MELAGLEPATSWVRCIVGPKWRAVASREWLVVACDLASAPTPMAALAYKQVPVWYPPTSRIVGGRLLTYVGHPAPGRRSSRNSPRSH